jgi:hypothetical protein
MLPRQRQREEAGMPNPTAKEPLYGVDWINGRSIEVFYADDELAHAFGGSPGWYWCSCYPGCLPDGDAFGPFPTRYRAYRDALTNCPP